MQTSLKKFIFFISAFCGLLFIGVSIPLIMGSVEPNHYYGIRVDQAFQSEELWYEINWYGGWALVIASAIMVMANVLLYLLREKLNNFQYILTFIVILMVCILTATFITVAYANTLEPEASGWLQRQNIFMV